MTIVIVLGILSALGPFSIDMYLPAFNDIAKNLNTNVAQVQLSLASYFIGISVGQLIYGPVIDRYGRRWPLLFGLTIYFVASLGCAFVFNIDQLVALRLLQALGGCAGMVVSRAMVRDLFEPRETAKVYSMLMLVMGAAPILAPIVGSYVSLHFHWTYIFFILSAISMLTLMASWMLLPESKAPDAGVSLMPGAILKNYLVLFKDMPYLSYSLTGALASAGMFSYISGSAFVYMDFFGLSKGQYAMLFAMNAGGLILCSQLNRVLLRWYTMRRLLNMSCIGVLVWGTFLLFAALYLQSMVLSIAFIFLFVSFLGFIYPNSAALALAESRQHIGSASAMMGALQMLFSSVAAAGISVFHNQTIMPVTMGMSVSALLCVGVLFFIPKKN